MFNLFEILSRAQGGAALDNMARQFGLSPSDTRRATEALLPALSLGFQHNALTDPMGFARLFWQAGQPQATQVFEQPGRAFSAQAQQQGELFLGQLFGSPQAGPRIAQQAAAMTGLGNEVMRQMLPVVAGMLVTGVLHAAMNQNSGDVLGRLAAVMGAPAPAPAPPPAPALSPMAPWTAFWGTFFGQPGSAPPKAPEPAAPPPDLVAQMFQAGVQVQDQYLAGLRNTLDMMWGAPKDGR